MEQEDKGVSLETPKPVFQWLVFLIAGTACAFLVFLMVWLAFMQQ